MPLYHICRQNIIYHLGNSTSEPGMLQKIQTSVTVDSVLKAERNPSNKYIDARPRRMIYATIKQNVMAMVKKVNMYSFS